jgi:hypothetical protein
METTRILLGITPIAAALAAVIFRHLKAVRGVGLAIMFLSAVAVLTILVVPHRIAASLHDENVQNSEWLRGARDTANVVHDNLIAVTPALSALAVLALIPVRTKPVGKGELR